MPKTAPYKKVKAAAQATQARLRGEKVGEQPANGVNGDTADAPSREEQEDPNAQLELEMRQADVHMSGAD